MYILPKFRPDGSIFEVAIKNHESRMTSDSKISGDGLGYGREVKGHSRTNVGTYVILIFLIYCNQK